mgnify:CR=1 FL=1
MCYEYMVAVFSSIAFVYLYEILCYFKAEDYS